MTCRGLKKTWGEEGGEGEGDAVVDVCGVRKRSRPNDSCKSSAAERKSLHGKKKKKNSKCSAER